MKTEYVCPVCSSRDVSSLKKHKAYPAIVFPVDSDVDVEKQDLEIYSCLACSHVFQVNIDVEFNNRLYTKYYKYYPYSNAEFFQKHYRVPFENIFQTFVASRKSGQLLEIGVSDARQLDFFDQYKFTSSGITPENISHPKIISSFYEDYEFEEKFDVIVSRFNLEHILNLDVFMSKVAGDLKKNGIFIAQVPNVEVYKRENILNFFVHEHTHYFNKASITKLFERCNFSVEAVYDFQSPSLIIVGVLNGKRSEESEVEYLEATSKIKNDLDTLMEKAFSEDRTIILYGAGLSLSEMLRDNGAIESKSKNNVLIFDDNPLIEGKNMPSSSLPIEPFNANKVKDNDLIILILNSVYHKSVIEKIRAQNLKNEIYCINRHGLTKVSS